MTPLRAFSTIQLNSSTTSSVRYSCVVFGMSHRSYGSHVTDTQLEEEETSVQNVDKEVAFDLPEEPIPSDDEEPKRVQGFFGVRPWSIKLSPSNPEPIEDSSPVSGTFALFPVSPYFLALPSFLPRINTQKLRVITQDKRERGVSTFRLCPNTSHSLFALLPHPTSNSKILHSLITSHSTFLHLKQAH